MLPLLLQIFTISSFSARLVLALHRFSPHIAHSSQLLANICPESSTSTCW